MQVYSSNNNNTNMILNQWMSLPMHQFSQYFPDYYGNPVFSELISTLFDIIFCLPFSVLFTFICPVCLFNWYVDSHWLFSLTDYMHLHLDPFSFSFLSLITVNLILISNPFSSFSLIKLLPPFITHRTEKYSTKINTLSLVFCSLLIITLHHYQPKK